MELVRIELKGSPELIAEFKNTRSRFTEMIMLRVNKLLAVGSRMVQEKLSGQVLHVRTGVLRGSVGIKPAEHLGNRIYGEIFSSGGPAFYGRVHEYGGKRAYEIAATKARALAFLSHGKRVYAQSVMHPPAMRRPFMRPVAEETRARIRAGGL